MTRGIHTLRDVRDRCCFRHGCHIWTGDTSSRGHPHAKIDGRTRYIRRWLFERIHGRVPAMVGTTCGNLLCCNPKHLVEQDPIEVRRRAAANVAQPQLRDRRVALGRVRNGHTKVDQAGADAIRASSLSTQEAAQRWGISEKHVQLIRRGLRWPPQQPDAIAMAAATLLGSTP